MKTTNDVCVHTWGNKKNGRADTNISQVSQPPAGPRIRAAQRPKILVQQSCIVTSRGLIISISSRHLVILLFSSMRL